MFVQLFLGPRRKAPDQFYLLATCVIKLGWASIRIVIGGHDFWPSFGVALAESSQSLCGSPCSPVA